MRDDREVTVIESDGGSGFKWFVIGAAMGAALGVLFAPQSGERTRRTLSRKARKLQASAQEKLEAIGEEVHDRGRRIKESVEEFAEDVTDEYHESRRKIDRATGSARDELERRLQEARTRRRAAVAADGTADDDADDDTE